MRSFPALIAALAWLGLIMPLQADDTRSAYAGEHERNIKALSQEDVAALRNGDGMGLAKAAELNGYPGPRHVLALAGELKLTESQIARVTTIRDRMSAAARPLGDELIERERGLDRLFAEREITPERLGAATAAIGDIQGRLRAVHLAAHLNTRALLSSEQITEYDKLRGYADAGTPGGHHPATHGH